MVIISKEKEVIKIDDNRIASIATKLNLIVNELANELAELAMTSELQSMLLDPTPLLNNTYLFFFYVYQEKLRFKITIEELFKIMYTSVFSSANNEAVGKIIWLNLATWTDEFTKIINHYKEIEKDRFDLDRCLTDIYFKKAMKNKELYITNFATNTDNTIRTSECYERIYNLLRNKREIFI